MKVFYLLFFFSATAFDLELHQKETLIGSSFCAFIDSWESSKLFDLKFINLGSEWAKDIFEEATRCNIIFSVINFEKALEAQSVKRSSPIIFVDNFDRFRNFSISMKETSFDFKGYFLIILKNNLNSYIEEIFQILWTKYIFNVNVLRTDGNSEKVEMFTFKPFNGKKCGNVDPILVNEFINRSMTWKSNNFFPAKFKDLKKCAINVLTFESPPSTVVERFSNGTTNLRGYEVEFLENFASALNFTSKLNLYELRNPNNSIGDFMSKAATREVNLVFGSASLQESRREILSATNGIFNDRTILIIPPTMPINPINKFFLPFDIFTWTAIFVLLLIAVLVITVLKLYPKKYRDFVVGKGINHEYMNLLDILLGGSQRKLPLRNFARFLFIMFTLFCFVMRNLHAASLFKLLANEIYEKGFNSIPELIQANYTFIVYDTLGERVKNESFMKRFVNSLA